MCPTRAERRETARQIAKEMLKKERTNYHTALWWSVASLIIPIAWSETAGGKSLLRFIVGWTLWYLPLTLGIHVFWRWTSNARKFLLVRYFFAGIAFLILTLIASYSIWKAHRPSFVLMWPGLVITDSGTQTIYFTAERRAIQNPTIIVWDDNSTANSVSLRPGDLDPRNGGFARAFTFRPANLGHESFRIFSQSPEIDTEENLAVETRGPALFPSWKAVVHNARTGKIIFECESNDFPDRSGLQACPSNPLDVDQ